MTLSAIRRLLTNRMFMSEVMDLNVVTINANMLGYTNGIAGLKDRTVWWMPPSARYAEVVGVKLDKIKNRRCA